MNYAARPRPIVTWTGILAALCVMSASGASGIDSPTNAFWKGAAGEVAEGFHYTCRVLNFGETLDLRENGVNIGNALGMADRRLETDLRLDVSEEIGGGCLSAKPRVDMRWCEREPGVALLGDIMEPDTFYVNEWLARWRMADGFCISYGRENLQWGPAMLVSPSNPFGSENGRNAPRMEVAGSDFGRAVLTLNSTWSVSLIANTDPGRRIVFGEFTDTYAVKVDACISGQSMSIIASGHERGGPSRVGGFWTWNATEDIVTYLEAGVQEDDPEMLAGCSYSLAGGSIVAAEYMYNGGGDSDRDLLWLVPPQQYPEYRESLLRKNYLLFQYTNMTGPWDVELTVRWILNLDERTHRVVMTVERGWGDAAKIFMSGIFNSGDEDAEFGGVIQSSAIAGMEIVL
ncbi:MAG: hypothetical protein WCL44_09770 [bacterium]